MSTQTSGPGGQRAGGLTWQTQVSWRRCWAGGAGRRGARGGLGPSVRLRQRPRQRGKARGDQPPRGTPRDPAGRGRRRGLRPQPLHHRARFSFRPRLSSAFLMAQNRKREGKRLAGCSLRPRAPGPPSGRAGRGAGRARADRGGPGATGKASAQRGRSASHPPTPAGARLARSPGHRGVGRASASPSLQVRLVRPALRLLPPPPAAVPPPPARPRSVALRRQRLGPPVLCGPRWSRPASPLRQVPSEAAGSQVASSGAAMRPASSRLPPSAGLQEPS